MSSRYQTPDAHDAQPLFHSCKARARSLAALCVLLGCLMSMRSRLGGVSADLPPLARAAMKMVIAPCLPGIGQRSIACYRLEDEEAMVDSSRSEKVPHGDAPVSGIFQRLATMCSVNKSAPKGLTGESLTTLQIAELQLERLTGIDLKAEAAKELEIGFLQLHFGTSFLTGNWLVRPHAFGGRPSRAVAISPGAAQPRLRSRAMARLACPRTPRSHAIHCPAITCAALRRNRSLRGVGRAPVSLTLPGRSVLHVGYLRALWRHAIYIGRPCPAPVRLPAEAAAVHAHHDAACQRRPRFGLEIPLWCAARAPARLARIPGPAYLSTLPATLRPPPCNLHRGLAPHPLRSARSVATRQVAPALTQERG